MRIKYLYFAATTAAAAAAALFLLKKKTGSAPAASEAPVSGTAGPVNAAPQRLKDAAYSFISGFKDAATVELRFQYDADKFSFSVLEDGFLTESGDSHVGVLSGEEFSAQVEYASYYSGENFEKLRQDLSAQHPDLADLACGSLQGVRFRDGDNLCLALPIPEDAYSYLLLTLVKAADNDDELEDLLRYPALQAILNSISMERS